MKILIALCCLLGFAGLLPAQEISPVAVTLDDFQYPYPIKFFQLSVEGQPLRMAYMDVMPIANPSGQTIVLMHGKNFGSFYWANTIQMLSGKGYRVIAVDQLGFGKSPRPNIHYSLYLLAYNTHALLDSLGVGKIILMGHSTGGMLATRYSILFPHQVEKLILEDPIGLEDYSRLLPYATPDQLYNEELNTDNETTAKYIKAYFVEWKPEYEVYIKIMNGWKLSEDYPAQAKAAALTTAMIYEQPVCYDFSLVNAKTLIIVGREDRTVIEKAKVPKELLPIAGKFTDMAEKTAKQIPRGKFVIIEHCGHIPHLEQPEKFHQALLGFLKE